MELELGLKITHTRDDITSFTDLRIAKDHAGPLFLSVETETMFNLIAYLKGFRKENIDIKISEDGNQITISGKKPVQELVLIGWIMHKKEIELRTFRKAFRIPNGVILDKIKAIFNDEELTLTITLPKLVKGIRGVGIEEVKEEEVDKGGGTADKAPEGECIEPEMKKVEQKVKSKEESEKVVEQKVDAGEIVLERVVDTTLQKKTEPKDQSELEDATPEKAEPPTTAPTATYQGTTIKDPKQVKPEKEIEHQEPKEPTPAEETESEELPGLKEQGKKQETPEAKSTDEETSPKHPERNELLQAVKDQGTKQLEASNQPSSQANQEHATKENHPVRAEISQESEKLETKTNVQEPTIPGPDQEKKPAETPHPADQSRNDEAQEINEATTDDVEEENESVEVQKQKDLGDGATNRTNSVSRITKLCPPLVVAGSAILVSIIVLVISWIRAKKR